MGCSRKWTNLLLFINFQRIQIQIDRVSSHIIAEELPKNPLMEDLWIAVQSNEELSKRILERTTTCQIVLLESLCNSKLVVVANTHLYFHPNEDHIRLFIQASVALHKTCEIIN